MSCSGRLRMRSYDVSAGTNAPCSGIESTGVVEERELTAIQYKRMGFAIRSGVVADDFSGRIDPIQLRVGGVGDVHRDVFASSQNKAVRMVSGIGVPANDDARCVDGGRLGTEATGEVN